ncbi:hypothetical protein CDAR_380891 [Caerostris darwini]|uniref:Uncharacterized protein n=1 Tax=Caerostris darwini TaxID=1538125 RepID=A0AAV4RZ13_9ARAC|nr:hypothetical protein CDAR_380891 [Caerostris darwini]
MPLPLPEVRFVDVQGILKAEFLHAFHLQRVQLTLTDDHPEHVRFAQWYLQQSTQDITPQPEVIRVDVQGSRRPGGWKMTSDNSIISEITLKQLHLWLCDVRRSGTLHKNDSI